jgi:hypothetical protein
MAILYRQVRANQDGISLQAPHPSRSPTLANLFKSIQQSDDNDGRGAGFHQGQLDDGGDQATSTTSRRGVTTLDDLMGPTRGAGSAADSSSGSLWGQVKPCWSRLPDRSTVPVTLEVILNDEGRLALPPRIIRPSNAAPDQQRLIAEARALTAIASCVPYSQHPVGPDPGRIVLKFGVSR